MIGLTVEIENGALIPTLMAGIATQIPFATSVAINNTLNDAQKAIRATLPQHFTLRRPEFIDRTIYIGQQDRARKDRLVGVVRVNPQRNFLAKFETDHEKTSRSGKALAIPIIRARDRSLIIKRGDALALKKVMDAIANREGRLKQRRKKGQPPPGPLGDVFLLKTGGRTLVMQRPVSGPDRTGNRSHLTVLYVFEHHVPIEPELHFDETALRTALATWGKNAEEAIAYALATAR